MVWDALGRRGHGLRCPAPSSHFLAKRSKVFGGTFNVGNRWRPHLSHETLGLPGGQTSH